MNDFPNVFGTTAGIILVIILIIWLILWFFVPFYIFSINKKIRILTEYYLQKNGKKISWRGRIVDR